MNRRSVLTVSASLLAAFSLLTACGSDGSSSPAKIRIGAGANAGDGKLAATSESAADERMARPGIYPMIRTVFELGEGLEKPDGKFRAWRFPKNPEPVSDSRKAALVKAFGLTGSWKTLPTDQGGGEQFVPSSGAASMYIGTDAMQNWWYSPDWSTIAPQVACAEPAIAVSEPSEGSGSGEANNAGGDVASDSEPTDITVIDAKPIEPCAQPEPPKNVPTADQAKQRALDLFESLGYDNDELTVDAYSDQWGASATAWITLDGQRSQVAMYVSFGAEGVVTGAGGFLAEPERADEYELVDLEVAVKRLNDQSGMWFGGYGGPMAKDAISSTVRTGSAVSAVAEPAGVAGGGSDAVETKPAEIGDDLVPPTLPTDDQLVDPNTTVTVVDPIDVGVDTVVDTTIPVEEVTVTLTKVRVELTMVWDTDGTVWLLPSYVFSAQDQGEFNVLALADEYIEFALPDVVPAPDDVPAVEPAVEPLPSEEPAVDPAPVPEPAAEPASGAASSGGSSEN